jgi:hypothetical protein
VVMTVNEEDFSVSDVSSVKIGHVEFFSPSL